MAIRYIIGVDEAGRGPLAGPVAVGVCVFEALAYKRYLKLSKGKRLPKGTDSKKLTPESRETWFARLSEMKKAGIVSYAVGFRDASYIDSRGIVPAIKASMAKAISAALKPFLAEPEECLVLLDGGLRPPAQFCNFKTIIKGDEKEAIIGLASIAAKVLRDRKMLAFDRKYPGYAFAKHKGYGTALHSQQIALLGPSFIHRKTFIKRSRGV